MNHINTKKINFILLFTFVFCTIVAMDSNSRATTEEERQAFFEASQTISRFFTCNMDNSNANGNKERIKAAEVCFRAILHPDVEIELEEYTVTGADAVIQNEIYGVHERETTNEIIFTSAITARKISVQERPWRVELFFIDQNFYEVLDYKGDGSSLGKFLKTNRNDVVLESVEPGVWQIVRARSTHLVREEKPNLIFSDPFPGFGSTTFLDLSP